MRRNCVDTGVNNSDFVSDVSEVSSQIGLGADDTPLS